MKYLSLALVSMVMASGVLGDCTVEDARAAQLDSTYGPTTGGSALTFNNFGIDVIKGTSNNYDFINYGITQTNGGQNMVLSGTMAPVNNTNGAGRYSLRAAFDKVSDTSSIDVKKELQPAAYTDGGIDPATWSFYQIREGSSQLVGIDTSNLGNKIDMTINPGTALQLGAGANGKNLQYGASGWFKFTATQDSGVVFQSGADEVLDININLGCTSAFTCDSNLFLLNKAVVDPSVTVQPNSDQALYVSEVTTSFGQQTQFELSNPGSLSVDPNNGNLRLQGNFQGKADTSVIVTCDLYFVPFIPTSAYMSKQELMPNAYVTGGGAIDPNLWAFYTVDTTNSACANGNNRITILGDHDKMGLQFGQGASGKNTNFGLSAWIDFADPNIQGAYFDINVDAVCDNTPNTALPETSTPAPTEVIQCPVGCVPIVSVVPNVTETPAAAGNGASTIEYPKLIVAILSLFILAFFH